MYPYGGLEGKKKMYQYLLFDLDGTLTDPGEGITNSVAHALRRFGIEEPDRTKLYKFIGPPLKDSFMEFYHMPEQQALLGIDYYREYFRDKGLFENEVYEDIPALLQKLVDMGKTLIVATSKPEEFSIRIMEHFDLAKYFTVIAGASMDTSRVKKADVIAYALEKAGVTDLTQTVMIGDREHDVFGAKENHLDSIGVLYGYGNREELLAAGADYIVEKPMDILKLV